MDHFHAPFQMDMDSVIAKVFQSVDDQVSKNKKFNNICKSNIKEFFSKVGNIEVFTQFHDDTAMISFDQPMAAFSFKLPMNFYNMFVACFYASLMMCIFYFTMNLQYVIYHNLEGFTKFMFFFQIKHFINCELGAKALNFKSCL